MILSIAFTISNIVLNENVNELDDTSDVSIEPMWIIEDSQLQNCEKSGPPCDGPF